MIPSKLLDAGCFCPTVGSMRRPEPHEHRFVRWQEVPELDPLLLTDVPHGHLRQLVGRCRGGDGKVGTRTRVDRCWWRPAARREQQGGGRGGDRDSTCGSSGHGLETHRGDRPIPSRRVFSSRAQERDDRSRWGPHRNSCTLPIRKDSSHAICRPPLTSDSGFPKFRILPVAWTSCACHLSASTGRSLMPSAGRSWMR